MMMPYWCRTERFALSQIVTNMTEDYGYWPPKNWEESTSPASEVSPATMAVAAGAILALGAIIGRLTAK
jgi:hypothetical protein